MTGEQHALVEQANAASYAMATGLRRICDQRTIRPADLGYVVEQLGITIKCLDALKHGQGSEIGLPATENDK